MAVGLLLSGFLSGQRVTFDQSVRRDRPRSVLQFPSITSCDCKHGEVALAVRLHRSSLADELAPLVVRVITAPAFRHRLHFGAQGAELSSRQERHGRCGGVVGGDGADLRAQATRARLQTLNRRLPSPRSGS